MASALSPQAADGSAFTKTIHTDTYPAISSATASNLDGKTVLVTGAAKGVGRETATSFARAGASQIAVADMAPFHDIENDLVGAARANGKAKPKVLQLHLDITDRAGVKEAANSVAAALGGLDILINNAGKFEPYVPFLESDPDSYWKTWDINLGGTFNVTRYFLPLLLNTKFGLRTIINISSVGALRVNRGGSGYRTTKFAMLRWTEFLNYDYGDQGLLAYCVHPGAILTELAHGMPQETHASLTDKTALPADTIVWLSQERREFLAGRYISCTWDMPQLMSKRDEIITGDKMKMRMAF